MTITIHNTLLHMLTCEDILITVSLLFKGYLKANPRFGPYPKVALAVIVGYFVGKLSYQQRCAEKLMALPNSYIGQLLRDRKEGKMYV